MQIKKQVPQEVLWGMKCDRCGREFSKDNYDDVLEIQEFLHFSDQAGYGNRIVGDMVRWSIDLCQDCVSAVLGEWIKTQ